VTSLHRQIRPGDLPEALRIARALDELRDAGVVPGVAAESARDVLVVQLIESLRRNRYTERIRDTDHSDRVLAFDPNVFDPLMGAMVRWRAGDIDDAFWLVFLSVHFGRHRRSRWALACNFYNRLGEQEVWSWSAVTSDVAAVRTWLDANQVGLKAAGAGFGNHRKYESLRGVGPNGTGEVIESYIGWVGESHHDRFPVGSADSVGQDFADLYDSMSAVNRFGRTAKFDYLTMLGKLRIVNLAPDRAYLQNATGPLAGARLLLAGSRNATRTPTNLELALQQVQAILELPYDVIEDALCNWQKRPRRFIAFRG
jgi:hypothetical protein